MATGPPMSAFRAPLLPKWVSKGLSQRCEPERTSSEGGTIALAMLPGTPVLGRLMA